MLQVWKEVIRPGSYYYVDERTGLPRKLVASKAGIQYWHETGKQMLAAGLSIPIPKEHQPTAKPLSPQERAAMQLDNNTGWVTDFKIDADRLFALCSIEDEETAKKLGKTIRWTSPYFNSFLGPDGKQWSGVVMHLALTSKPRITSQQPFPTTSVAMSVVSSLQNQELDGKNWPAQFAVALSIDALLEGDGAALKPAYPVAFSYLTGIALSEPPKKDDKKGKTNDDKSAPPKTPEGKEQEPGKATPLDPSQGDMGKGATPALIDPDGDMDVEIVLCKLMDACGIPMPEDTDKATFTANAFGALMQYLKGKAGAQMGDTTNQPPGANKNNLPPNPPVVPEQPPLYMSLEEINKIADPTLKGVAMSLYAQGQSLKGQETTLNALKQRAFDQAKTARGERIKAVVNMYPPASRADMLKDLEAMGQGAAFSLDETTGTVNDSLDSALKILERGAKSMPTLPDLLTMNKSQLSVLEHPKQPPEQDEPLTNERVEEVATGMTARFALHPDAGGTPTNGKK